MSQLQTLIAKNLSTVKKVEFASCWIFPCALKGVFLCGINVKELYFTKCGLASYANSDWDYSLNQFYGLARLVENFALSWTECNGGYPSWHPMLMLQ